MLYLWEGTECPNKHIADYDREQSPDCFLLLYGTKCDEAEFSQCYAYARSSLVDLADDPFIRTHLRPAMRYAYILTPDAMFYCAGGLASKIKISRDNLNKVKMTLSLTDEDIDKEPKILSDQQLDNLRTLISYPHFSRTPRFTVPVTMAVIEKKYDSIHNNSSSPLVNQKIIDILLKLAPDDVQFFDAEVHCKDGVLKNYKLLNLTSKITGIDREKSIYTLMQQASDVISGFKYLTYKPGCMEHHKLARDAEYLGNILVTEEIKQAFEREKVKGIWDE